MVSKRVLPVLDPRMFSRFRPTATTIRKMRLDYFLGSQVQKTADLGLDFSCFLLRYNKELSHGDFIDDVHIQNKLRRAESFRMWVDLEDVAVSQESIQKTLRDLKAYSAGAVKELSNRIEEIASRPVGVQSIQQTNTAQQTSPTDTHHILMRLEAVEQGLLRMNSGGAHADLKASAGLKEKLAKYNNDVSPQGHLQVEALKETMNIISALKEEVDSQAQATKALIEATNLQVKHQSDFTFRKIMNEIEPIKADVMLLKSRDSLAPTDVEQKISKANSRFFEELSRLTQSVATMRQTNQSEHLRNKVNLLEQEIVESQQCP